MGITDYIAYSPSNYVMSDYKLNVIINNKNPVDLVYLTDSLISLGSEYKRYVHSRGLKYDKQTKLYVKEIRSGSIEIDLIDLLPITIAFMEDSNTMVDFVNNVKMLYQYFTGKSDDKPEEIEEFNKSDFENLHNIITPIANDSNGSQITFGALKAEGNVYVTINNFGLDHEQSNAAQNRIRNEIKDLETPDVIIEKNVLMSLKQATDSSTGDKGVIDSISGKPMKLIWNDGLKEQILELDSNFFKDSFEVDVEKLTVRGSLKAYRIVKIHSIIED